MEDLENSGPVYIAPVKHENIIPILTADSSEWFWILLPNGDRMVGFYPLEEGAEYFHAEDHRKLESEYRHVNEIELYGCDACDRLVPEDEIHHSLGVNNGQGDTSQCSACINSAMGAFR